MKSLTIQINKQNFQLHASGVLFWIEKSILMISDVHLGKVSHFRKYGAAVPQNAIHKNFDLLSEVTLHFRPSTICFMGDLFHSALNKEWNLFENWVKLQPAKIVLVAGNHDIISPLKYEELGILVVSEVVLEGFLLTHHPEIRDDYFNLSGHIHPGIRLHGKGRQTLRLSCFFKSTHQMILPAFGTFTGKHILEPKEVDSVYAITKEEVFKVY